MNETVDTGGLVLEKMAASKLAKECATRGLNCMGDKDELIVILRDWFKENNPSKSSKKSATNSNSADSIDDDDGRFRLFLSCLCSLSFVIGI